LHKILYINALKAENAGLAGWIRRNVYRGERRTTGIRHRQSDAVAAVRGHSIDDNFMKTGDGTLTLTRKRPIGVAK
jgi:hypothetical protein